jgi:hypothetical protein
VIVDTDIIDGTASLKLYLSDAVPPTSSRPSPATWSGCSPATADGTFAVMAG